MITKYKTYEAKSPSWEELIIRTLTQQEIHLIENAAKYRDVNELDKDLCSPLILTAYHINRTIVDDIGLKILTILTNKGADWKHKNNEGEDFIDVLKHESRFNDEVLNNIIELHPDNYELYKISKEANKFNI